jgi:hypothetical protein
MCPGYLMRGSGILFVGYITIPFMSLLAFIAITFLLITGHTFKKRNQTI